MSKFHWVILKVFMWSPMLMGLLRWCRHPASFSLSGSVWTGLGAGFVRSNWRCQYCTSTEQLIQECYCPGSPGLFLSPVPRGAGPAGKPEDLFQDLSLLPLWNPRQFLSSWATRQTHAFNKPCQGQWIFFFLVIKLFGFKLCNELSIKQFHTQQFQVL